MIGLDTNVLVRFLVQDNEVESRLAARALTGLTPDSPGFVTQVTLVELHWVLFRSYGYSRETCLDIMQQLVASPSLEFDDAEGVVRALTLAQDGADFADALIEAAMELFGVTHTVTFDRRAARVLEWEDLGA